MSRIAWAPLSELLASVNGEVVVLEEVDEPKLLGAVLEWRDTGRLLLVMPPRRPVEECEHWVRVLLARREGYSWEEVQAAVAGL